MNKWALLPALLVCLWSIPTVAQNLEECSAPSTYVPADGVIYTDTITVDEDLLVTELNVFVDITNTWVQDLRVELSHEDTEVLLHSLVGAELDNINATYSDIGIDLSGMILFEFLWPADCDGCRIQPIVGEMSDFDGLTTEGDWDLGVSSTFAEGTLNSWCVINYPCGPVTDVVCEYGPEEGEVDVTYVNGADYDSVEFRIAGEVVEIVADPAGEGVEETIRLTGLPTPQLALIDIVGIVAGEECAENPCAIPLPTEPLITKVASPDREFFLGSLPVIEILEFDPDTEDVEIADLQVELDITDPWLGGTEVAVASNSGTAVMLHNNNGGFSGPGILATYWHLGVPYGSVPFDCDCFVRPSGPGELRDFVGEETVNEVGGVPSGSWIIEAHATTATDVRTVNEIELAIFDSGPAFGVEITTCEQDAADFGVINLEWINGADYSGDDGGIQIRLDGVLLEEDPGDGSVFDLGRGESNLYSTPIQELPREFDVSIQGFTGSGAPGPQVRCRGITFIPTIAELSCSSESGSGEVEAVWVNGAEYDAINVFVDGELEETIAGDAESYTASGPFETPSSHSFAFEPVLEIDFGSGFEERLGTPTECSAILLAEADLEECDVAPADLVSGVEVLESLTIQETEALVDLTTNWLSVEDYDLSSPAGTTVRLHDSGGTGNEIESHVVVLFDDDGIAFDPLLLDCACAMRPQGSPALDLADAMSAFDGELSLGTWTFSAETFDSSYESRINLWCIRIFGCPLLAASELEAHESDTVEGDMVLSWINGDTYDEINIYRDGALIDTVPGDDEMYTDPRLSVGRYEYVVAGTSPTEACEVTSGEARGTIGFQEICAVDIDADFDVVSSVTVSDPIQVGKIEVVYDKLGVWSTDSLSIESPSGTEVGLIDQPSVQIFDFGSQVRLIFTGEGEPLRGPPFHDGDSGFLEVSPQGPGELADFEAEIADGGWVLRAGGGFSGSTIRSWCVALYEGCGEEPPEDLVAESAGSTVTVSWTNPVTYDEIDVIRDGIVIATVEGDVESYEDQFLPPEHYRYRIVGIATAEACRTGSRALEHSHSVLATCSAPDLLVALAAEDVLEVVDDVEVEEVRVSIDVTFAWIGDLIVSIEEPSGTSLYLHDRRGGEGAALDLTYADRGSDNGLAAGDYACRCLVQPIGNDGFAVDLGGDQMEDLIDDVTGPSGDWILSLTGGGAFGSGTLNEWCVELFLACPVEPPVDVTCISTDGLAPVDVDWTNSDVDSYDEILVERDGVIVAEFEGDQEAFTDVFPSDPGIYVYRVLAVSTSEDCTVPSLPCVVPVGRFEVCDDEEVDLTADGAFQLFQIEFENLSLTQSDGLTGNDLSPLEDDRIDIVLSQIGIDVSTTSMGDHDFSVFSPEGTGVRLQFDNGGAGSGGFIIYTDDADPLPSPCCDDDVTRARPAGPGNLSDFEGENAGGDWTLISSSFETGVLEEWCVYVFPVIDALAALDYAYGGADPPPSPFPDCGLDGEALSESLSCDEGPGDLCD